MKVYWIERNAIAIAETVDNVIYTSPTEIKQVTLFITSEDEKFTSTDTDSTLIGMNESTVIPEEFHEALVMKVVQQGYESNPQLIKMAPYFENQYNLKVIEGKRMAKVGQDGSNISIVGQDF